MSEESLVILERCPFCNGSAYFERLGNRHRSCIVQCEDCGARLESGEEAGMCGTSWNHRPYPKNLSNIEAQLHQSDVTAMTMGLMLSEARAENERLREALEKIAGAPDDFTTTGEGHATCKSLAREVLKKEGA